jgi:hypothetical protein
MVFSLASNFEFSMASISTGPWSAGVVDAAGLSGAATVLEAEDLPTASGGAALVVAGQSIASLGY